jgi:hypothetical protein
MWEEPYAATHDHSSFPSSGLGTHLSAKLCFVSVAAHAVTAGETTQRRAIA